MYLRPLFVASHPRGPSAPSSDHCSLARQRRSRQDAAALFDFGASLIGLTRSSFAVIDAQTREAMATHSDASQPLASTSEPSAAAAQPMHSIVPPPPATTAQGTLSSRPARVHLHSATPPPALPILSASAALAFAQSQSHLPAASVLRGHMHAQPYATSAPGEIRAAMMTVQEWDRLVEASADAQRAQHLQRHQQQQQPRSAHVHHSSSMRPLARGATSSRRRAGSNSNAKLGARSRSAAAGAFASSANHDGADSDDASASASANRSRSRLGAPSPLQLHSSLLPAPYFAGQGFSHFPLSPGAFFYSAQQGQQQQSQAMQLAPGAFLPSPMPFPTPAAPVAQPSPSPSMAGSPQLQQQGQAPRSYALHFESSAATPAAASAAAAANPMHPSAPATSAADTTRTPNAKRRLIASQAVRPATALERVTLPRNADGHARLPPDPSYASAAASVPQNTSVYGPSYTAGEGDVTATPTVSDLRALAHRSPLSPSAASHAASSSAAAAASFNPAPLPQNLSRSQLMQPAFMDWFYSGVLGEPSQTAAEGTAASGSATAAAGVAPMLTPQQFAALVYAQQLNLFSDQQQQPTSQTLTLDLPEQGSCSATMMLTTPLRPRDRGDDDDADADEDEQDDEQAEEGEEWEEGHDVVAALDSERSPSPLMAPMHTASPPTPLPLRGRPMAVADQSAGSTASAGESPTPTPPAGNSRPRTSNSVRARSAASSRASWRQTGRRSRGGPSSSSGSRPSSAQMLAPPPTKMHAAIQSMLLAHAAGRSEALALITDGTAAASSSSAAERARLDFLLSTPAQRELEAAEQGFLRLERRRAEDAREWREWLRLKRAAVRLHRSQQRFQSAQARKKEQRASSPLERPSSSFAHNSTLAATRAQTSGARTMDPSAPTLPVAAAAALVAEAEAEMDAYTLAKQERELIARCDAELAAATARITTDAGLYAQAILQPLGNGADSHLGSPAARAGLPPTHPGHGHVARAMSVSLAPSLHQSQHATAMRQRSTGSVSLGHGTVLHPHPHAHSASAGNGAAFSGLGSAAGSVLVPAGGFPDFAPPVHLQPQQYNFAYSADAALLLPPAQTASAGRRPVSAARAVGEEKESGVGVRSRSRSRPGTARAGSRSRAGSRPGTASGLRAAAGGLGSTSGSRPDSASAFGSRAAAFEFQAHRIVPWVAPSLAGLGGEITGPLSVATAAAVAATAAEKQQAAAAASAAAAAAARSKRGLGSPCGPTSPSVAAPAATTAAGSSDSPPQLRGASSGAHVNGGRPVPRAFTLALNEFERGLERQAAARAQSAGPTNSSGGSTGGGGGEKPPVPTAASLARERASLSATASPSGRAPSKAQAYGHGLHRLSASATTSPSHSNSRRMTRSPGNRSSLTKSLAISLPSPSAPNGSGAAADGSSSPQLTPEVESEGAALDSLGVPAWKLAQLKSASASRSSGPRLFHSDRRALARSARDPTKVLHHTAGPKLSAAGGVGKEIATSWHGNGGGSEAAPASPAVAPLASSFVAAPSSPHVAVAEPAALAITLSAANHDTSHAASVSLSTSTISPDRAAKPAASATAKEKDSSAALSPPQPPATSARASHGRRPSAMFSGPPVAAFPMPSLSGAASPPISKRAAAAAAAEEKEASSHKARASARRSLTNNQHSLFRAPANHDDIAE